MLYNNITNNKKAYLISWMNVCTKFQKQLNNLFSVLFTGNMKRSKSILNENMNNKSSL